MPAIQTSYNERLRAGLPGLVVNMETANSITRTIEALAGIAFGLPVVQGAGDKGVLDPDGLAYAAAGAAVAGNTGNGTITAAPVVAAGVKAGVYKITFEDPATNAGSFFVEDPDGIIIDMGQVGVAFVKGGLTFTVADGATDFVEGDQFTVTVTATAGGGIFRGITIRDPSLVASPSQVVDVYQKGNNAALLTAGVIWVTAGGAVRAGQQAYFNTVTKRFVEAVGFPLPNCTFETSGANADVVQLRVSHL